MNGFTFDYLLSDPNYKTLIDEVTVGPIKYTYIGKTPYTASPITPDTSMAIWQIIVFIETTGVNVYTERSLPLSLGAITPVNTPSTFNEFIWDNRLILTYV